jgi:hypothetical protein
MPKHETGKFWLATDKYAVDVYSLRYVEGNDLTQRVVCQQCGFVLYEGAELKPPDEILHQYNSKCPKCGKKLSLLPINVEVKPIK